MKHRLLKSHKLITNFKQTRNKTKDDDVEQSSTPNTDTEVQTVLGSSSKPMVNADANASPEPVSVMGYVISDVNIKNMALRNQWDSWRKKQNTGTAL